jgi:asparagine synthase (glutamine-hydrolysing)
MNSMVGFWVSEGLDDAGRARRDAAFARLMDRMPWLKVHRDRVGSCEFCVWGHGVPERLVCRTDEGGAVLFAGSPDVTLDADRFREAAEKTADCMSFRIPWDGRTAILKIEKSGASWTVWSDWCGSLPVFYAHAAGGAIAATLEPVIVAAGGYTSADFSPTGMMSLLVHGHYVADGTLFRDVHVVPPDCRAEWRGGRVTTTRLWTVAPSDARWQTGWDQLTEEMHDLFSGAVRSAVSGRGEWTLPLSGGLDSRLIAAVCADQGVDVQAVTYGERNWDDAVFARAVAGKLGIPWRHVELGPHYLKDHTPLWADWFGSALHFHGMYQIPFLQSVFSMKRPIVTGFIGDPLAGAQTAVMMEPANATAMQRMLRKSHMWTPDEALRLMRHDGAAALDEVSSGLQRQYDEVPGEPYQKTWFVFWWNHVFGFSYYQPMMYDYWCGVATPFLNRACGRFALSLPRAALDGRRLQADMLRRFYPDMARIPGTYAQWPHIPTLRYMLKYRLATCLPRTWRRGPFRMFNPAPNTADQRCIGCDGDAALWPLREAWGAMGEYFDMSVVEETICEAAAGSLAAVCKIEALQPIAYRLLSPESTDV